MIDFRLKKISLGLALIFFTLPVFGASPALKELPVQNGGRIKPLDTLASESIRLVYGKTNYQGKDPSTLVLTWLLAPRVWSETEFVQLKNRKLKKALNLENKKDFYSQKELASNPALESLLQNLKVKQDKEIKLGAFDQALSRLQGQLLRLNAFQSGDILRISPPVVGAENTKSNKDDEATWQSINEFSVEHQQKFAEILKTLTAHVAAKESSETSSAVDKAVVDYQDFAFAGSQIKVEDFKTRLKAEVFFNSAHPFRYAWIVYTLALLSVFFFWLWGKKIFLKGFGVFLFLGFLLHLCGFLIRVYISGRAPVSNMYETVLWVPFGTILFGFIIGKWNKSLLPHVGACIVAVFCLILSDLAPVILDPSIQPLEAVLRSNFWLLVHVLTITISYSAFFLAFILGDFSLFYHLNENKYRKEIPAITTSIYRSLQIGIVLLATGTILGGVWADYSWGRFWGWDPKETWAFIALMGYLALLHARLVGLIKSFGMAAGAVLSFSLVIMAWYGVNFWLGAGLHSYGFGSGGVEYVSVFVMLHIFYVLFVGFYKKLKNSELKVD
jgi:ABC-type transport system involved in cytochrome c biogenesis permease subunit